jgi:hypothetical protein
MNDMLYLATDFPCGSTNWGCFYQTATGVSSPWFQAFQQTTAWENSASAVGACTTSAITGGTMWKCPLTISGSPAEIDWCAVQNPATCTTTTTFGTKQTINGTISATGGTLTLNSTAMLVYGTLTPTAATPTFSPAGGPYTSAQTVTISDATPSPTIYYTLDGSTPTTSSSVYSSALTVSASETINAIATASGYLQSGVGTAAYIISLPPPPPLNILVTSAVN